MPPTMDDWSPRSRDRSEMTHRWLSAERPEHRCLSGAGPSTVTGFFRLRGSPESALPPNNRNASRSEICLTQFDLPAVPGLSCRNVAESRAVKSKSSACTSETRDSGYSRGSNAQIRRIADEAPAELPTVTSACMAVARRLVFSSGANSCVCFYCLALCFVQDAFRTPHSGLGDL